MTCESRRKSLFQYTSSASAHGLKAQYSHYTTEVGQLMFLGLKRNFEVFFERQNVFDKLRNMILPVISAAVELHRVFTV